jgi:tetratricopeptide (TPR) repeat protein
MKLTIIIFLFFTRLCVGQTDIKFDSNVELIKEKAWKKYDKEEYDSALFYFNNVIVLQPKIARNYFDRGNCYYAHSKYSLAIKDFETGCMFDSTNSLAYYQASICKYNLTNYKGAFEDISKAIYFQPEHTDLYYHRIDIQFKLNNFEGVLKDCKLIMGQDSSSYHVYTILGKLYYKLKDYKSSLTYLEKALKIMPLDATAYYYRGRCNIDIGMKENGYDDINKAYDINRGVDLEILILGYEW